MEDNDGEYDELEDDFLLLANEGKPALIIAATEKPKDAEEDED